MSYGYGLPVTELSDKIASLPIQQSNEWIDVRDNQPKFAINQIVWCDDGMTIGAYDDGIWYGEHLQELNGVTHYQPLPNPPITNN